MRTRIPNAVEELLRLTSPVQNLARTTTRDVRVRGTTIPAGKKVLLCYAAANRDDREFGPTAEDVDVERRIAKLLTFSHGTHYCIGAAAARLQGRVVLEELLARCPQFTVDVAGGPLRRGQLRPPPRDVAVVRDVTTVPDDCDRRREALATT